MGESSLRRNVGLYLAARAGYDVSRAPDIWRRLDAEFSGRSRDHPTSDARFEAMSATAAEIAAKREASEKLIPNGMPTS